MITHTAILRGQFMRDHRVLVTLDVRRRIVACNAIKCLWSGTPRFDWWFRSQYAPEVLPDGGTEYHRWRRERSAELSIAA